MIKTMLDLTKIRIRDLGKEEYLREDFVKPFIDYKTPMPSPENSLIKIAELDEKIKGFLALQPYYFIEPMWIDEDSRGTWLWKKLVDAVIDEVKDVNGLSLYCLSQDTKMQNLIKRCDFIELPHKLARRIL